LKKADKIKSAVVPALAISGANAYWLWTEHWEHWNHLPPLPERTEYPYQNIRTKNFQWGDGDKVSRQMSAISRIVR
jgi:cytochrome c oxidase subunit 6a